MESFKVNDFVKCVNPKYPAYTGTVTQVFVGFVRVTYSKPVNGQISTLTSPINLELVSRPGVVVEASSNPPQPPAPIAPFIPTGEPVPPAPHILPPLGVPIQHPDLPTSGEKNDPEPEPA